MKKLLIAVAILCVLITSAQQAFHRAKAKADAASHYAESEIPQVAAALKQHGRPAQLRVVQIIEGGILARGALESESGGLYELREPIFVHCQTGGLADGDRFDTNLFKVGTLRYKTTLGSSKTVHSYTESAEDAARKMLRVDLQLPQAREVTTENEGQPGVSRLGRVGGNFGGR